MRHFIETHMNWCLIAGCALGLIWPYWGAVPNETVIALIMGATFIACFHINMRELSRIPWKLTALFYTFRFILLPLVIYHLAGFVFPQQIALGLMLIATLPVGASAPAMTHVFGGQVAMAAVLTLLATLLSPLIIPSLFALVNTEGATPPMHMFYTLIISLTLPCVMFLFVRRSRSIHHMAYRYGKSATILMISLMIAIVIGKQRHLVFEQPVMMLQLIILTYALFAILILVGWCMGYDRSRDQQIALATASGFNNIGLGVGMALFHFSPTVLLVAIATEIAWAFLPIIMRFISSSARST